MARTKQCSAGKLVEGLGVFAEMHHINDMKVAAVVNTEVAMTAQTFNAGLK